MKSLIIIPAYNVEKNIENVVSSIIQNCPEFDYLVINDGSTDHTAQICMQNGYSFISLPVNLGIGGTIQAGYMYALNNNYDIAIQIDGDGQHDPRYIKKLLKPLLNGQADICIGSRFLDEIGFKSSATRRFGIRFLSSLIRLCSGIKIRDVTSGFRATNKRAITFYAQNYAQDYPEPEAIIAAVINHLKISEVPVVMKERNAGSTSISPIKSLYYMIKVSLAILLYRAISVQEE